MIALHPKRNSTVTILVVFVARAYLAVAVCSLGHGQRWRAGLPRVREHGTFSPHIAMMLLRLDLASFSVLAMSMIGSTRKRMRARDDEKGHDYVHNTTATSKVSVVMMGNPTGEQVARGGV